METIPKGTVAFLFTDIEGSTRLWEAHPEAMKAAVESHDAMCRAAIESRGGYVFKTVGDAFCAAFSRAADAIGAAAAIRRELSAAEWGETPIRVRMGVHAGAAEERDGDYFGQPVNRAARISAAGSGGQILVSLAASELARDGLPAGCSLRDLGLKRLKDLSAPERLFQLDEQGFRSEFPPLKTLDERPNNLPRAITTFFGRSEELAKILGLMETAVLVTLTGPGGTGKTRLSLEVAASLVDRFRDGVWFVDLCRISDPGLLPSEIARAIGLKESPSLPVAEALINRLREAETLLILDNCEHLVEACASWAAEALAAAPGLKVLATSREALLVSGETTFRLAPLPVPSAKAAAAAASAAASVPEALTQFEAVRLFIDRAAGAGRSFRVDAETAPYIAGICERLEGMPLALELAAAQLRFLTLSDLYGRLGDLFEMEAMRTRGGVARQATLQGLVDWSWDLLDGGERKAWRWLSLFRGGFSMEAARAVLGDGADSLVEALSIKSIVSIDPDETGSARFRMLEIIREYGKRRLDEAGEHEAAAKAFTGWLAAFASEAEAGLFTLKGRAILDRLDGELANVMAGLEAALGLGQAGQALGVLYDLRRYLFSERSPLQAVAAIYDRIAASAPGDDDRMKAMLGIVKMEKDFLFFEVGDSEWILAAETTKAALRTGDGLLAAIAKLYEIEVLRILLRVEEGFRLAMDVIASPPQDRGLRIEAEAAMRAGAILCGRYMFKGDFSVRELLGPGMDLPYGIDPAAGVLEVSAALKTRGIEMMRKAGDVFGEINCWLADELVFKGDLRGAEEAVLSSVRKKREMMIESAAWWELDFLSNLAIQQGEEARAWEYVREFKEIVGRLGIPYVSFQAEESGLALLRCLGKWKEAESLARALVERAEGKAWQRRCKRVLGLVLVERGLYSEARSLLESVMEGNLEPFLEEIHLSSSIAALWRIHLAQGDDARSVARAAGALLAKLDRQVPKFGHLLPPRPVASWRLPEGFGFHDLAELNWTDNIREAHPYEGLFRAAEATLEREAFETAVREGRDIGKDAYWPIPSVPGV